MRKIKRFLISILDFIFPSDIYNRAHKFAKLNKEKFNLKIDKIQDFAIPLAYKGEVKNCIIAYKYRNKPHFSEYFSKIMAEKIANQFKGVKFTAVVSIPTILEKKHDFDHAEYLAQKVATQICAPYIKNALIKTRKTEKQHFLTYKQRHENVKDLYIVNTKTQDKIRENVLLIDDIVTTGATISSAANELLKESANKIYVAAIAYTSFKQRNRKTKI